VRSLTAIISVRAVTGTGPALLRWHLVPTLRERLSSGAIWQIALLDTGGDSAAWLPASHLAGRSLDSCAGTCLRASLDISRNLA
jgi:hypothetical protein